MRGEVSLPPDMSLPLSLSRESVPRASITRAGEAIYPRLIGMSHITLDALSRLVMTNYYRRGGNCLVLRRNSVAIWLAGLYFVRPSWVDYIIRALLLLDGDGGDNETVRAVWMMEKWIAAWGTIRLLV